MTPDAALRFVGDVLADGLGKEFPEPIKELPLVSFGRYESRSIDIETDQKAPLSLSEVHVRQASQALLDSLRDEPIEAFYYFRKHHGPVEFSESVTLRGVVVHLEVAFLPIPYFGKPRYQANVAVGWQPSLSES